MTELHPLQSYFDHAQGSEFPLPPELAAVYGSLRFPTRPSRPLVIGNFVSTLDGVVDLGDPGHAGGGPISGSNSHDRMIMGILRSTADAVIVGAGTLRSVPSTILTGENACPALAAAYAAFRASLAAGPAPLNVVVTASGELDPALPLFKNNAAPVLVVTTVRGRDQVRKCGLPDSVTIVAVTEEKRISARSILDAVGEAVPRRTGIFLVEGGPHLLGDFLEERILDELFLTLAPQIAGRSGSVQRPGLEEGHTFAPEHPLWGELISIRRGGSHLFLRYSLPDGGL